MKPITLREFLDALRSGKFEQGINKLCRDGRYCCLGVLCELTNVPKVEEDGLTWYSGEYNFLPLPTLISDLPAEMLFKHRSTFNIAVNSKLLLVSKLNDNGCTFAQIADAIETRAKELGWNG